MKVVLVALLLFAVAPATALGAGTTIVTNAHVLPAVLNASRNEGLAILIAGVVREIPQVRSVEESRSRR